MDYLQYQIKELENKGYVIVLNLIINGLPSILGAAYYVGKKQGASFKPYYKWITFNTI